MNIINLLTSSEKTKLKKISFKENISLFHEGEISPGAFFLVKGKIKIVTYSLNGEEELLSLINEGEMFSNALIFNENNYFLGEVISIKEGYVYFLLKEDLIDILMNNRLFLLEYLKEIGNKTIKLNQKNKLLGHKSVRSRIIYYLETNGGKIKKNVSLMAKEIIIPRPSVSRELSLMKDDNLIKEENGYLYLNN